MLFDPYFEVQIPWRMADAFAGNPQSLTIANPGRDLHLAGLGAHGMSPPSTTGADPAADSPGPPARYTQQLSYRRNRPDGT